MAGNTRAGGALDRSPVDAIESAELVAHSYPVMLDLSRRKVVIVGGGAVAARKARGLLDAGAGHVCCVAPEFCDEVPPQVQRITETYRSAHLDGASLVFAATDQAVVNDVVARDAHARNLLVNRADSDEEEPGDFSTPAALRRGKIIVTIAAGSPALSRFIRDRVGERFDPVWQQMADAMRRLRPSIRQSTVAIAKRRQIFRDLASEAALEMMERGGFDALRGWLLERHPELRNI